jgi:hypothetical protein
MGRENKRVKLKKTNDQLLKEVYLVVGGNVVSHWVVQRKFVKIVCFVFWVGVSSLI